MTDDQSGMGLAALAELNYLRLEAMDLFERCLTEGRGDSLESFIERQIARQPPRLELLREVAEDLHKRLAALREYRSDILERTWQTLRRDYGFLIPQVNVSAPLAEIEHLGWHNVTRWAMDQGVILSEEDQAVLRKMVDTSLQTVTQLSADIGMTERLFESLSDWVEGLSATAARRSWFDNPEDADAGLLQ